MIWRAEDFEKIVNGLKPLTRDIMSSAFRASFFRIFLLLVSIRFFALPTLSGQALLTGMMQAILANELMIGHTSQFIVLQICLSAH